MKLFRMVTAALIMLAMAMCPAMAETEREYTADEQAYAAYLDINYAFGDTIEGSTPPCSLRSPTSLSRGGFLGVYRIF